MGSQPLLPSDSSLRSFKGKDAGAPGRCFYTADINLSALSCPFHPVGRKHPTLTRHVHT